MRSDISWDVRYHESREIMRAERSWDLRDHENGEIVIYVRSWDLKYDKIWEIMTSNKVKHPSQIGSHNCLNCSMKVVYYIFTSTPGVVRNHFRTNPKTQVFWENQFFSFCGVPKNIFWPQKPYLALETPTLGGSYF